MLAVATSPCFSQTSWTVRDFARELLIIVAQFGEHLVRQYEFRVIIFNALVLGDFADRVQRRAADLAGVLGDVVGHGEDLVAVLIE